MGEYQSDQGSSGDLSETEIRFWGAQFWCGTGGVGNSDFRLLSRMAKTGPFLEIGRAGRVDLARNGAWWT